MTGFLGVSAISGPAGTLEIATALPVGVPTRLAIVCHPHPLFGGTMQNKVVTSVERCLRELSAPSGDGGSATLRFNFRGVGASNGSYDDGVGESEDLRAVFHFARSHFPALPLDLAGFSFGSFVAARMANALNAARLISIAPPVSKWDFRAFPAPTMPWIIVQGEQDEIVAPEAVYNFVEQQQLCQRGQVTLIRLADCTHFFHGKITELRSALSSALQ